MTIMQPRFSIHFAITGPSFHRTVLIELIDNVVNKIIFSTTIESPFELNGSFVSYDYNIFFILREEIMKYLMDKSVFEDFFTLNFSNAFLLYEWIEESEIKINVFPSEDFNYFFVKYPPGTAWQEDLDELFISWRGRWAYEENYIDRLDELTLSEPIFQNISTFEKKVWYFINKI